MVSFAVQKLLCLIRLHLIIFVFIYITPEDEKKKIAMMLSFLRNEQIVSHSNWTILNPPHQCTRISVFSSTIVIFILTLDIFY